jgi:hypothetical protein
MTIRTRNKTVSFTRPFLLKGVDRVLPAGDYRVATDEELIQELSFPVYRRVATMIFVPAESHRASSVEMVSIDPRDLEEALDRDAEDPAKAGGQAVRQVGITCE